MTGGSIEAAVVGYRKSPAGALSARRGCYDRDHLSCPLLLAPLVTERIPRFLADAEFPPYTFVPGQTPHPVRDPQGHQYGEESAPVDCSPEPWQECREFLQGVDLFNHGYYWEAHEAWEAVWHAAGRSGPVACLVKGLIKLAAAGVKTREGSRIGRRRHCHRAADLFRQAACAEEDNGEEIAAIVMGLPVGPLAMRADEADRNCPSVISREGHPPRVFSFLILPAGVPPEEG